MFSTKTHQSVIILSSSQGFVKEPGDNGVLLGGKISRRYFPVGHVPQEPQLQHVLRRHSHMHHLVAIPCPKNPNSNNKNEFEFFERRIQLSCA
jgi:hypothetical protein